MDNVKVTGISIRDLGCIAYRVIEVGPDGVEVKGPCGTGKTTIGDAIEMTLVGKGISRDCIRRGADRSEVLVHCEAAPDPSFTVRQVIPRDGRPTVTVRNDQGDTRPWQSPREKLLSIFGSMFDPSRFLRADKAERLKMLTEILPMPVTAADLERWTGAKVEPSEGKHGLEVIDEVRARFVEGRRLAKKSLDEVEAAQKLAQDEAERLATLDRLPAGVVVPLPGEEDAPVRAAEAELQALQRRQNEALAMEARTRGTRERIARLRQEADQREHTAPMGTEQVTMDRLTTEWRAAGEQVSRLRDELREAELAHRIASERMNDAVSANERHDKAIKAANALRDQAGDLEETLAEAAIASPAAEDFAAAEQSLGAARARAELVRSARAAHDALVKAAALGDEAAVARKEWRSLDAIVDRLTNDAPAEMVARTKAIPGLAVVDGQIFLDGVAFDRCGGAEQRRFAVTLAKRANPNGRLVKMDEVGNLDDRTRAALYEEIIQDGWTVIALRPWCDPDQDLTEPVVVPIKEAVDEARGKRRLTVVMPDGIRADTSEENHADGNDH